MWGSFQLKGRILLKRSQYQTGEGERTCLSESVQVLSLQSVHGPALVDRDSW